MLKCLTTIDQWLLAHVNFVERNRGQKWTISDGSEVNIYSGRGRRCNAIVVSLMNLIGFTVVRQMPARVCCHNKWKTSSSSSSSIMTHGQVFDDAPDWVVSEDDGRSAARSISVHRVLSCCAGLLTTSSAVSACSHITCPHQSRSAVRQQPQLPACSRLIVSLSARQTAGHTRTLQPVISRRRRPGRP